MFARVKKSGQYQYLQIVENRREGTKTIQHVISTIGRMDRLRAKGEIENLVRSLSRYSEKVLLILSGKRSRFHVRQFCIVADRGIISNNHEGTGRQKDSLHPGCQDAKSQGD